MDRESEITDIQRVSEAVDSIIEAKEESWNDVPPKYDFPVAL
jgi:hypothetical protein